MEKTSDDLVVEAREWSMNKINSDIPMENVKAIYEEFQEWIDIDEDDENIYSVIYMSNVHFIYGPNFKEPGLLISRMKKKELILRRQTYQVMMQLYC